ncbi:MAG TPA: hypothetical protein VM901_07465 [Bdellovibrionota bacterium]|jgi:hypothetical protein|nr:hypothetical protein [Bdellovibrionota bacterium]
MTKNSAFHFWLRSVLSFVLTVVGMVSASAEPRDLPELHPVSDIHALQRAQDAAGDQERVRALKAHLTEVAVMLRHGDITMENYAHELKTMMGEAVDLGQRKLADSAIDGFMEYYRALAWNYGLLHARFHDAVLEVTFVSGYAERVRSFVEKTNIFAGLMEDFVGRLANHEDYWLDESYQEIWRSGAPYGWFGEQWKYVAVHVTREGQQLLTQASSFATATNLAFFRVREALPYPDEEPGAPNFWFWMIDQARVQALVHFDESAESYLKGRKDFLGMEALIKEYRREACALTLAKLLP